MIISNVSKNYKFQVGRGWGLPSLFLGRYGPSKKGQARRLAGTDSTPNTPKSWPLPRTVQTEDEPSETPRFYFPLRERQTIRGLELWKNITQYRDFSQGPRKLSIEAKTAFYKEVKTAMETALLRIRRITMPVTSVVQLAQIAAQCGDLSVAEVVASAFVEVGKSGLKMVIEGPESGDFLRVIPAVKVESIFLHPLFIQSVQGVQVLKEPYLLLCDGLVQDYDELLPFIEFAKSKNKPLVIIGKNIEGRLLLRIVHERLLNQSSVYLVELKRRLDRLSSLTLNDIAVVTGGKIVTLPSNKNKLDISSLTEVGAVFSTIHELLLMNIDLNEAILKDYVDKMKKAHQQSPNPLLLHRVNLLENCRLALLFTGGSNKNSRMYRMGTMEDALSRAQAAYNHGILPGGGRVLLEINKAFSGIQDGSTKSILAHTMYHMYAKSLEEPYRKDAEMYMNKTSKLPLFYSYDPGRGEYVNLVDAGVLESSKEVIEGLAYALEKAMFYKMKVLVTKVEPEFHGIFDVDVDSY